MGEFVWLILAILFRNELLATTGSQIVDSDDGMSFLFTYGYLKGEEISSKYGNNMSMAMFQGLKDFQKFYNLPESGLLDATTMSMMNQPRCSNPERMDIVRNSDINRNMSHSRGWTYSTLRYNILNSPRSRSRTRFVGEGLLQLEEDVRRAFAMWELVANISFVQVGQMEEAEIKISFVEGEHEDGMPFGERAMGIAVAHAFFPSRNFVDHHHELEGDIHFDMSREWLLSSGGGRGNGPTSQEGVNFLQVCAHEIGHALGLEHSMEEDAVMHMIINPKDNFHLHEDDIRGIQNLYGPRDFITEFENEVNDVDADESIGHSDPPPVAAVSAILDFGESHRQQITQLPLSSTFEKHLQLPTLKTNYISEQHSTYHSFSNTVENMWSIKSYKNRMIWTEK